MAIPIEGYTVVLLNERLDKHLPGGKDAFPSTAPNSTCLTDAHLSSISFMAEADALQFLKELVQGCPDTSLNALDGAIVSGARELPTKEWLSIADWNGSLIAWKTGEEPNPLIAPEGWEPGKSSINYCTQEELDRLEFIGVDDGVESYRDRETGEMRYVGRPKSRAESLYEEATRLVSPFIEIADRPLPSSTDKEREAALVRGIEMFETVLETNPDAWGAWWHLGKAHQARGDAQASYDAFARSYELEKGNPNVAREFMLQCLELGLVEKGLEAAEHAVSLAPDNDGHISNLALALLFAERHKEALKVAKRARRIAKDPITDNLIRVIKEVKKGRRPQPKRFSDL